LISASLDPENVLAQVCQSVSLMGGGERSAVFLVDPDKGQIWMAYAHELSDEFVQANLSFSILQEGRTRCLTTGKPDIASDVRYAELDASFCDSLLKENILAMGDFPLTTPEGQIGYLSVYHNQVHKFLPEELELLQTYASDAAIAVSNARLYARTDIALSRRVRQLSILEAVGRELAANLHSDQLFTIILNYALEFTGSQWGSLGLYEPDRELINLKASRGYPHSLQTLSVHEGINGRAVLTDQILNIGDVRQEAGYQDLTGGLARAHLSVPLTYEGRVLGVLTLEKPDLNAYNENDETFSASLAVQAAVAVVNAELYAEIQRRLREQSTLYLVSSRLSGDRDLGSVLGTVQRAIQAALEPSGSGVYLWSEHEQNYRLQAAPISENRLQTGALPAAVPARIPGNRVNRPVRLPLTLNADSLGAYFPRLAENTPIYLKLADDLPQSLQNLGQTAYQVLLVPLVVPDRRLGALLFFLDSNRIPSEDILQLVNAIASQGAISLQNALLFNDISGVRDRLAAVLNSVREGILMIEMDGRISLVNESVQRITGLRVSELIGQPLASLSAEALAYLGYTRADAYFLTSTKSHSFDSDEPKATYRVGQPAAAGKPALDEHYLERVTMPVWGRKHNNEGWMIVLRDISQEHLITETRQLITETLVHDLRSPLSAVVSAIDVMEGGLTNESQAEIMPQALQVARRGSMRVLGMIESLLDISRLQSGSLELTRIPVDMQTVVDSVLIDFLPQAQDYGVIVHSKVPPGLVASADLTKITRVITNLLDNALKFTPPGGKVAFTGASGDGLIELRISDSGPGVPVDFREKIFDQFAQVPGQRGRRRGSGLGLTFCKLAVEAHGGRIWVETPSSGGSVFVFTLPAASQPSE
ncbi:MAG TPA: GAF domain-containing protein, partial [Anaerolineales bacterium]|nr:GAF domain-containing protein [Anaerolineales bacterium]